MLRPGTFALTALLAALTAIGPLTTDMYLPSLPDIVRQLSASTAQGQLTLSAYLVGFAAGQIFYGPVSDRHGRKVVIVGALAIYALATLVCALSPSIEVLIAARAVQGFGGSGGTVLARAVVRDMHSGVRAGRELSVMASAMALAPVLAPLIGGSLQTAFGWRPVFATLMIVGVAAVVAVWLLLPETIERRAEEPFSLRSMAKSFGVLARSPVYLSYLGLGSLSYAGLFGWISGASFVLQNLYGLSAFQFGAVFGLGSIGYMTGSAISARVVHRLGLDGLIGLGAGALALGGLGMVVSVALGLTSALSLVLPAAVYLGGLGMVLSQAIAGALTPFPERAGAASSLFGFTQQCGAALSGVLVGWLLGNSAWPMVLIVAAMGLATLVLWLLTRGLRRRADAKT